MPDSVQMNVNILPETRQKIDKLAAETFRRQGALIDWVVALVWRQLHPDDELVRITPEGKAALAAETVSTETVAPGPDSV